MKFGRVPFNVLKEVVDLIKNDLDKLISFDNNAIIASKHFHCIFVSVLEVIELA